ncbi:sugar nucleotide-binding protein [Aquiflexum sp. TKW24L]|uniref:family 1 glycosylhydrolase n=1 Tax=Aquiflexum sp. TKW24L TaxID=2942212 RepID=UPI0020BDB2FB|nr:family 1 glycosylhydrolase [Aquiflexum sp. TKW24L]MCL6258414.1 sugar nucleotide-binding protein [Aquiflexum sp. TKW24L]
MKNQFPFQKPEIWGGIECTINRIQNNYRDQLDLLGHYERADDLNHIAQLGIKALRYPVLWEHHQQTPKQAMNWDWIENQLNLLNALNIVPIAGLVHHGSGPSNTNLLDDRFPYHLADYASQVAAKFPKLEYYTPVNEPLTTARFSGLYGFWYPHAADDLSFATMLINQVKGVVLAMKAIRKINPAAKLVQTEDLAKTHSTPLLKYQADFENNRRWLTYDLLCGKVNNQHPLWQYFLYVGIKENELDFLQENTCVPDIIGLNYYVTSERYLDENLDNYPSYTHGANGQHRYADTEMVRVTDKKIDGFKALVKETWKRYKLPIAITEVHLNCTREEQMRWFKEIWDEANQLSQEGINLKAVTAWSLLGAYDWNSLLTESNFHYETGVFDIRNNKLRPTAAVKLIKSLSENNDYQHPLLDQKGWWHNSEHLKVPTNQAPILIIGETGTLGSAFVNICKARKIPFVAISRADFDIFDLDSIINAFKKYKPWAVVNATGYVRVDDAESDAQECFAVNSTAPALLSQVSKMFKIQFLTFSSDLVFSGSKNNPYTETDIVSPLNVYGESKVSGEKLVITNNPDALIIRTSAFFGPWDKSNFAYDILQAQQRQTPISVLSDVVVSPTYVPDLVNTALNLLIDEEKGIWHLSNQGSLTWADFASEIASRGGMARPSFNTKKLIQMKWKAKRPLYSVLHSERGILLPTIENALHRYFEEKIY